MSQIRAWRKLTIAVFVLAVTITANHSVFAATLTSVTLAQSDPRVSNTSNQTVTASSVTTSSIKCIQEIYSLNPTGTTLPTGFSSTGGGVSVNTGNTTYISTTGWSLDNSVNGTFKYTKAAGATPPSASNRVFEVDGVTNGNTSGITYYLQFSTYDNTDCTTSPVDSITIQFQYTHGQLTTVSVDSTLMFTVAGVASAASVNGASTTVTTTATTVPLGRPTVVASAVAAQDIAITTNAGSGYTAYIAYTSAPTSGSNTITSHSGTNAAPTSFPSPGTEAFGYTTEDTTLGTGTASRFAGGQWAGFTTTNSEVAFDAAPVTAQTTRIGFQVGISTTTKAGNYITTVLYTVVPVY